MKEKDAWDRFWGSGKIEDYLYYTGAVHTPEINAADMVVMNNTTELSGIGGVNTFGMNNLPAIARQEELNAHSIVAKPVEPAE